MYLYVIGTMLESLLPEGTGTIEETTKVLKEAMFYEDEQSYPAMRYGSQQYVANLLSMLTSISDAVMLGYAVRRVFHASPRDFARKTSVRCVGNVNRLLWKVATTARKNPLREVAAVLW